MKAYKINHFSINLPQGNDQNDVPSLLEHLSKDLRHHHPSVEIQDIVFHNDIDESGISWPGFTVYYHNAEDDS